MVTELRAMISISFVLNDGEHLKHFRDILLEHSGLKKNTKNGTFVTAPFAFSCLPQGFRATI